MNYRYFSLFILLFGLFYGCATINPSEITELQPVATDTLQLTPMLDVYGQRLDIIRNKIDPQSGGGNGSEKRPHHDAGFYLGNGLFYDLNGNLCFLIFKSQNICGPTFIVRKKNYAKLFNRVTRLIRDTNSFSVKIDRGIAFSNYTQIKKQDSCISISKGKLSKKSLVLKQSENYEYKHLLADEKMYKTANGFYIKHLFNRKHYIKKDNTITLSDDIVIKRHQNAIEVFDAGWGKNELAYQIKFAKNKVLIYNKHFTGYKIEIRKSHIKVFKNQRLLYDYQVIER